MVLYNHELFFEHFNNNISEPNNLIELICWLCKDKYGKNILYKDYNKERYKGFKLYKMITRSVEHTTPSNMLSLKILKKYLYTQKETPLDIFSIDDLPHFYT